MFQGQNLFGKKNSKKVAVGYDLGQKFAQISFCGLEETEPETVSAVAGTEQYNIPVILCKRRGVGQWYYGKEAIKFAREGDGVLVEELLERCHHMYRELAQEIREICVLNCLDGSGRLKGVDEIGGSVLDCLAENGLAP